MCHIKKADFKVLLKINARFHIVQVKSFVVVVDLRTTKDDGKDEQANFDDEKGVVHQLNGLNLVEQDACSQKFKILKY